MSHYRELYPLGRFLPPLPDSNNNSDVPSENPFALLHVLVLSDLYIALSKPHHAITAIRQGVRWLQGRGHDNTYWDSSADDREFDNAGFVRNGEDGDIRQGFYDLDINSRSRLCVARIKIGDVLEGSVSIFISFYSQYSTLR